MGGKYLNRTNNKRASLPYWLIPVSFFFIELNCSFGKTQFFGNVIYSHSIRLLDDSIRLYAAYKSRGT